MKTILHTYVRWYVEQESCFSPLGPPADVVNFNLTLLLLYRSITIAGYFCFLFRVVIEVPLYLTQTASSFIIFCSGWTRFSLLRLPIANRFTFASTISSLIRWAFEHCCRDPHLHSSHVPFCIKNESLLEHYFGAKCGHGVRCFVHLFDTFSHIFFKGLRPIRLYNSMPSFYSPLLWGFSTAERTNFRNSGSNTNRNISFSSVAYGGYNIEELAILELRFRILF